MNIYLMNLYFILDQGHTSPNLKGIEMATTERNLFNDLMDRYGSMVGGKDLYLALGFKSYGAFRLANERNEIPIKIFKIPKRRDWYGLTSDLVQWQISLTQKPSDNIEEIGS
ncbi:hypothetical protein [Polynucleobacter yangtzensis]|uniref:hypothetical protein n=1 Tax=Polynucleobacter yangtzensis TaxID=1743159 RepID=UPI001969A3C7|nr:hypothetical protein [Polynucleobacter yangtzensis]